MSHGQGFEDAPLQRGSQSAEKESPGTKQPFYWGFLDKQTAPDKPTESMAEKDQYTLNPCQSCGQPTTAETCSYCKIMAKAKSAALALFSSFHFPATEEVTFLALIGEPGRPIDTPTFHLVPGKIAFSIEIAGMSGSRTSPPKITAVILSAAGIKE